MKSRNFCRLFSAILMALPMSCVLLSAQELQTKDEFSHWDGTWLAHMNAIYYDDGELASPPRAVYLRIDSVTKDIRMKIVTDEFADNEKSVDYKDVRNVIFTDESISFEVYEFYQPEDRRDCYSQFFLRKENDSIVCDKRLLYKSQNVTVKYGTLIKRWWIFYNEKDNW